MKYSREGIEEKYKDLFEYSLDMIYVNDLKGNFLDANDIALERLGYKREDIPNLSFIDLVNKEELMKALEVVKEIKDTGKQSKHRQYKLKTKEGTFIYVETFAIPLRKNGRIYAVLGIADDITESKLAEQRLRDSEERYRILFEDSPFSIVLLDSGGNVIDFNPATEELLGYKKEEVINKKFINFKIFKPDFLPVILDLFMRFVKGEEMHRIDAQMYKKDGDLIWANLQASLVKLDGETFVQAIFHDITDQKRAELLIKEEINKLKELDQIRKDLISRVSHELKTPLVSIYGGSELLLGIYKDRLDIETIELIELIQKGSKRLKHLVDNLLDITRIEYEKFKLEKERYNLSDIVKEISEEMKYLIKERNLVLNLEFSNELYLELDRIRIEQVITNLLLNAIKNTPPMGI
ncbi:MAG: PAS domain S-box protein, partial [Candidatus Hermodarchaeota archaeon]